MAARPAAAGPGDGSWVAPFCDEVLDASRAAASTAAATGGDRPMPSSTSAGSQPTTSSRPISPPSSATMPSTARGSIWWASSGWRVVGVELGLEDGDGARRLAPAAARRPARPGRSPRAARRRGARPGCRSPRPARPSGIGRPASRWATSLPNPSSRLKMLPMPATSVFVRHRTAPLRRGGSRGSGRATGAARRPGRRRGSTATCWSPSTSKNTPSTVAMRPTRNRSWASVRAGAAGPQPHLRALAPRRRRRCGSASVPRVRPRRRRPAPTTAAASALGAPGRSERASRRAGSSNISGAKPSTRSTMAAARGSVPRASTLLVVGQRQDPQGEDLVDLGGVAHVARALGGHLGPVVEDDRRRQDVVVVARVADQHREGVLRSCTTSTAARANSGGSSSERNEPSSACSSVCTPTSERRIASSRGALGLAPSR